VSFSRITDRITSKFEHMGARVLIRPAALNRWRAESFGIDVRHDNRGPYFDIAIPDQNAPELEVLDVQSRARHLLLMARQNGRKDKFLCGHDERHWFTCAVPGQSVSNVKTALEALKPAEVRRAQVQAGLRHRDAQNRRNAAFVRQGEWFFLPEPGLIVPERLVLHREPLSRGGGSKAHMLQDAYRMGGEQVYVSREYPMGLLEVDYKALLARKPNARNLHWTPMRRNAGVYARGFVSHADHATITLRGWHRVLMNTEHEAPAAKNIVFLD
jgi:hypothetical protein